MLSGESTAALMEMCACSRDDWPEGASNIKVSAFLPVKHVVKTSVDQTADGSRDPQAHVQADSTLCGATLKELQAGVLDDFMCW